MPITRWQTIVCVVAVLFSNAAWAKDTVVVVTAGKSIDRLHKSDKGSASHTMGAVSALATSNYQVIVIRADNLEGSLQAELEAKLGNRHRLKGLIFEGHGNPDQYFLGRKRDGKTNRNEPEKRCTRQRTAIFTRNFLINA